MVKAIMTERALKGNRSAPSRARQLCLGILLLGLALGLLWLGLKAWRIYDTARRGMVQLEALQQGLQAPDPLEDLESLRQQALELQSTMAGLQAEIRPLAPLLAHLGWVPRYGPELAAAPPLVALAANLSGAGAEALEIAGRLQPLLEQPGEDALAQAVRALQDEQGRLERIQGQLRRASEARASIEADQLDDGPFAQVGPLLETLDGGLPPAEQALELLRAILPQADPLLGLAAPQRYLLLGQSNFELRATGGFLGSLGPLTVQDGRVVELDYRRSPEWDNPEREKVQPPKAYERYMRFGAWFIRDANWYADFATSAQKVEWFWELDGHEPVQGVIAVDLYALQNVLPALGRLDIPGYGLAVGGPNALETIWQGHRQSDDFLGALVDAAIRRLQQPDMRAPQKLLELAQALHRSLEEKHILLYFDDPNLQQAVLQAGWGGALHREGGDFVMVVDSDFSWAEVNRFVDEEIHYQVTLDQNLWVRESTITIHYWNHFDRWTSGSTNEPFGGACFDPEIEDIVYSPGCYGNYIRLYLPDGSQLLSAEGFDDGVERYDETGRTVIAGYLRVFPGEQRTIEVSYRPPAGPVDGAYRLTLQKQPGTEARPIQVQIRLLDSEAEALLQTDLRVDRVITATWDQEQLAVWGAEDLLVETDPAQRARRQAFAAGLELWQQGRREEALEQWRQEDVAGLVLDEANRLLSGGYLEEARELCQAALELAPEQARAHFLLGSVLGAQGDAAGAIAALEQAVALEPQNRSLRQELGLLYEAVGDTEQAYAHLQQADPAAAKHILWQRAWEHFNGGQDEAGLATLRLILRLDPQDANAHFVLGDQLRGLKRYEQALAAYEAGHQVAPEDVRFYLGRGHLYADQGLGEQAIAELEAAVALAPAHAYAWFNLGQYRWRFQGDAAGAIAALEKACELDPNPWYFSMLGQVCLASGDLEAAVRAYEVAVRLPDHNGNAWLPLGQAYAAQGRWERAAEALEQAVAAFPEDPWSHAALARAYEALGRIPEAIAAYQAALALRPGEASWERAVEALER
ncbi:MAG: tetratricopeptide repeat protein [Chloroflexia bacterium]|nr:tetratricopeptide repeat protein [Chloroflexia bacterium]